MHAQEMSVTKIQPPSLVKCITVRYTRHVMPHTIARALAIPLAKHAAAAPIATRLSRFTLALGAIPVQRCTC